jgi:hypothetical protein
MVDEPQQPILSIGGLSKHILGWASDIQDEDWPNKDAQKWYLQGVRDVAHLMILKWTSDEQQPEDTV